MTVIEKLNPKVQYNGPIEINDALSINFPYTNTEDVKCVVNNEQLVYNQDYTVLEQTLTIKIAIPQGQTITIYRATPLDQQAEFPQNNRFNSAKLNASLDKICMQQQEQNEKITRSVKVPIDTNISFEGSLPTPIANRILRINDEASGFEFVPYDLDDRLDTFEDTVVDNITAGQEAIENSFEEFKSETNININNIDTKVDNIIDTANTANTKSDEAVSTANTANTKANEAVSIVNTALTAATNAVNTANAADTKSDEAIDTADAADTKADTAIATANTAINTANTASTTATNAANTANTANTKAGESITIANAASTAATNAVNTANSAVTLANTAVTTANTANTKANEALSIAQEAKEASLTAEETAIDAKEKVDVFEQDIEAVLSAADQIAQLETAVNTALQASEVATQAAEDAIEAVENTEAAIEAATQAAEDATQAAADATQAVANVEASLLEKADKTDLNAHINNKSNPHAVTKSQVGLGNVDNTSDISKPISNATQAALNNKLDVNGTAVKATADGSGNNIVNTYRKISDSYTKTEVDSKLASSSGTGDGKSITKTVDNKLQAVGILDARDTSTALKYWSGTRSQYDAIATKDNNTIYQVTDDTDVTLTLLETLYPVGAIYIGTMATCPLATLGVGNWVLKASDRVLQGSGANTVGSTVEAGLPNITGSLRLVNEYNFDNTDITNVINGAFSTTAPTTAGASINQNTTPTNDGIWPVTFDASRSSSIYGNNETVQPPAYIVNIWERIS